MSARIPITQILARSLQWELIIVDEVHHCVRMEHNVKSGTRKDARMCERVTDKLQNAVPGNTPGAFWFVMALRRSRM